MKAKMPKSEVIRARCEPTLKEQVQTIARFQSLEEADIVRMACIQFVNRLRNNQPMMLTE